jgi:ketosteroid isomerase-like protein
MIRFLAAILFASLACGPVLAQKPAAPAVTTAGSPEVQEFQKIEDSWSAAINARDQYGLELALSPLFVDISASGDITTRNQQIVQILNGEAKELHAAQKAITVRKLGDVAVVNGTYELNYKTPAGPAQERGVFTHVYERSRNSWVCINSQRTLLRENVGAKSGKKPSSTEAPFHIPFFSK